ncbi:hypothetical protein Ms3S1_07530 [Methylosinus sp. 3S-1]
MFETHTYNDPEVVPPAAREHWDFMETNSAAAVMKAVCPGEWKDIVDVLSTYRLVPEFWLKAGGTEETSPRRSTGGFRRSAGKRRVSISKPRAFSMTRTTGS